MWTLPWSLLETYISLPSCTAYPEINSEMESCMQKVCWSVSTGPTCVRKCGNSTEQMEKLPFRALAVVTLANPTIPLGALALDFPSEWFHLEARSTGLETLDPPVTSLSPIPLRETSNLSMGSVPHCRGHFSKGHGCEAVHNQESWAELGKVVHWPWGRIWVMYSDVISCNNYCVSLNMRGMFGTIHHHHHKHKTNKCFC